MTDIWASFKWARTSSRLSLMPLSLRQAGFFFPVDSYYRGEKKMLQLKNQFSWLGCMWRYIILWVSYTLGDKTIAVIQQGSSLAPLWILNVTHSPKQPNCHSGSSNATCIPELPRSQVSCVQTMDLLQAGHRAVSTAINSDTAQCVPSGSRRPRHPGTRAVRWKQGGIGDVARARVVLQIRLPTAT